jgi:hypothetical protein
MPDEYKAWTSPSKQNARLDELFTLFGCGTDIAPLDTVAFGRRAGELIARVTLNRRGSKPRDRRPAIRKVKTGH